MLLSGSSSYTENGFTLNSTGVLNLNTQISNAVAPGSASDTLTLTAADGGLFALYWISLRGSGPVTFTGTTANGAILKETFPVTAGTGFQYFAYPRDVHRAQVGVVDSH